MIIAVIIFAAGYALIALESLVKISKSAIALAMAGACWLALALAGLDPHGAGEALLGVAEVVFFLMGAMAIVETVDTHGGFGFIAGVVRTENPVALLWILSGIAFFLSPVLDNLTTTIVMVALANALIPGREGRLYASGMIVIAANAGGAWSPIGDVTTTMLWLGDRVSPGGIVGALFLPSLVNLLVPLSIASLMMARAKASTAPAEGAVLPGGARASVPRGGAAGASRREGALVLACGAAFLVAVPVLKVAIGLPPWLGMLFGFGLLWILVTVLHRGKGAEERERLSASGALGRIDHESLLFFAGILLAVAALEHAGVLAALSGALDSALPGNRGAIAAVLGLSSAVIDNVPLVAASMGLYDPAVVPRDHAFWELLAYCAGTGGSILIIGSAAGVAAMGIQKISFGWYLKRFAPLALLGYAAGIGVYALLRGWG